MKDLFKKFYNNVLVYEQDIVARNKIIDEEIKILIEPYKNQLNQEELEELKSLLASISLTAEITGFEIGIRFVVKYLLSLIKN